MIQQNDTAVSIRLVTRDRKIAGLNAGNGVENGPQKIRLGGIDGDGQDAARREFENGAAILAESVLCGEASSPAIRRRAF